jgi:hypothetical protein
MELEMTHMCINFVIIFYVFYLLYYYILIGYASYTNPVVNTWKNTEPLVVTMYSTVPQINEYCLQFPTDIKCANPLAKS